MREREAARMPGDLHGQPVVCDSNESPAPSLSTIKVNVGGRNMSDIVR